MRPVARPPWSEHRASLEAVDAAVEALGEYCSACEIPLRRMGAAWNAATGRFVTGPTRAADWPDLLVLCAYCAAAVSTRSPADWGHPLLPHRDLTFALGGAAPFRYELRPTRPGAAAGGTTGDDSTGDDSTGDVVDRVLVLPQGESAADAVRLFGLNRYQPAHPARGTLAGAERAGLPLTAEHRRRLLEFDDPRLKLRTLAWHNANRASELYREMSAAGDQDVWAHFLAGAMSSRGFWSVWASVLTVRVPDLPLVAGVLAPSAGAGPQVLAARPSEPPDATGAFPATRGDWLRPDPPDSGERS